MQTWLYVQIRRAFAPSVSHDPLLGKQKTGAWPHRAAAGGSPRQGGQQPRSSPAGRARTNALPVQQAPGLWRSHPVKKRLVRPSCRSRHLSLSRVVYAGKPRGNSGIKSDIDLTTYVNLYRETTYAYAGQAGFYRLARDWNGASSAAEAFSQRQQCQCCFGCFSTLVLL